MKIKHEIGKILIPKLPFNRHVFNHFRLEVNAFYVRNILKINPFYRKKLSAMSRKKNIKANIGCGPFGKKGWINLDLYKHPDVSIRYNARWNLPFSDNSCDGLHVEHFFEHLSPEDEAITFLKECKRCLDDEGVLRIIVPDARLYINAYINGDWNDFNNLTCGGEIPEEKFETKMQVLNHVFNQEWEHYGAYDDETIEFVLKNAGFSQVKKMSWSEGDFPGGCIDRKLHASYSLYYEAQK